MSSNPHLEDVEETHALALPHIAEEAYPEVVKPETAKWLALLIDTEGSMGWVHITWKGNKMDEQYRYLYHYAEPYISIGMSERESKATVDEAAEILNTKAYSIKRTMPEGTRIERNFRIDGTKALTTMRNCLPHFVKFKRLATLTLTLFKYHVYIRTETFDKAITQFFGRYLTSAEANRIILDMSETQFNELLEKAQDLANKYLR